MYIQCITRYVCTTTVYMWWPVAAQHAVVFSIVELLPHLDSSGRVKLAVSLASRRMALKIQPLLVCCCCVMLLICVFVNKVENRLLIWVCRQSLNMSSINCTTRYAMSRTMCPSVKSNLPVSDSWPSRALLRTVGTRCGTSYQNGKGWLEKGCMKCWSPSIQNKYGNLYFVLPPFPTPPPYIIIIWSCLILLSSLSLVI